ncbi:MAG: 6-phosphogluconolactonase [Cryomorphaceae bacterium]|jgi:6-phosphogluconolactonase
MIANYEWHEAADPESLANQLAMQIIAVMDQTIEQKGSVVLALSGGSTPKPLFKSLATADLDWSKVIITLVDERWVPKTHELSNAAFMQTHLLDSLPDVVRFIPLYEPAESAELSTAEVLNNYCSIAQSSPNTPRPFDIVVLGMGGDGHTASFFPDADNITDLVDPNSIAPLLTCNSTSTQVDRITWNLPMLLNAQYLALHITGDSKKRVFSEAVINGPVVELPIRSVIFQQQLPLQVFYAD